MDVAISDGIIIVALDDLDVIARGAYHDAHMIRPTRAVTESDLVPSIIYHVTRQRNISLILLPASYALKPRNLALTKVAHQLSS